MRVHLHTPGPWEPMSTARAALVIGAVASLWLYRSSNEEGWVPLLDWANLVFHEAGHPIFGLFGRTAALYGGTLGQLVFPTVAAISFWYRRNSLGYALCVAWFFENFHNIAYYMADARSQELPLVGGGDHDWANILERWGMLHRDVELARRVRLLGWLGLWAVAGWTGWRWWIDRTRPALAGADVDSADPSRAPRSTAERSNPHRSSRP